MFSAQLFAAALSIAPFQASGAVGMSAAAWLLTRLRSTPKTRNALWIFGSAELRMRVSSARGFIRKQLTNSSRYCSLLVGALMMTSAKWVGSKKPLLRNGCRHMRADFRFDFLYERPKADSK
ncbi:hypothetical protein GAY28_01555 [Azospirillum brasilense]|nr:hypothetical protein [Azospirillum brasilense]